MICKVVQGDLVSVAEFITVRFQQAKANSSNARGPVSVAEFITVRFQQHSGVRAGAASRLFQ